MFMTIFKKFRRLIRNFLGKIKLINPNNEKKIWELYTPSNEKPVFFYKTWDRFYTLSVLMSSSLIKLKGQNLEDLYIAEAGIGIGNTFEYLALVAEKIGSKIVGFDSFKGFHEIKNPKDKRLFGRPVQKGQLNDSSVKSLKKKLINSGLKEDFILNKVELVEGYFENSLKNFEKNKKIFFLHIDVDLYSSYKTCLEELWDNVITDGIIVFDEYSDKKWPGAREAIDEFLKEKGLVINLEPLSKRGFVIKK